MNGTGRYDSQRPAATGRGASFRPLVDKRAGPQRVVDVMRLPNEQWVVALQTAIAAGFGVLLAPTSDGGALSLTVYDGEERYRSYCGTSGEFEAALQALTDRATARGM